MVWGGDDIAGAVAGLLWLFRHRQSTFLRSMVSALCWRFVNYLEIMREGARVEFVDVGV